LYDSLSAKAGNPPKAANMLFVGNPGTGKTTVGRLVAKLYHELGLLRKPKFLEVERLDMVGRTREQTLMKTREVIDEARGGILFIDEAYTLSMSNVRGRGTDCGDHAISEIIKEISIDSKDMPLIILAGFPEEINQFVGEQPQLKKYFPLLFQFPDYTCKELARIFLDMTFAKGFDVSSDLTEEAIGSLLEAETTSAWRRERNGRVSEMLLSGVRTQVRMRMRTAAFEERDVDSQLIIWEDVENVVVTDFK
jgi:stage V sporulation protein K